MNKNFLIVLSAPSGCGKTTLEKLLIQEEGISNAISVTTRPKRPGEVDGVDYQFISECRFKTFEGWGKFIETSNAYGNSYGILKEELDKEDDIICVVNYEGFCSIKKNVDKDRIISIFIVPPSIEELERRLINRNPDEDVTKRLNSIKEEMTKSTEYQYVIVNDDLETAKNQILHIIKESKKL